MTTAPQLTAAMLAANLDPSMLETVFIVDGTPVFAFRASSTASLSLLECLERRGDVQALSLGPDLDRWRQFVADRPRREVGVVVEAARVLHAELSRIDAELDNEPPPRPDYRRVLVDALHEPQVRTFAQLRADLAAAPIVARPRAPIERFDDEERVDAEAPAFDGHWIALFPSCRPHEVLARLVFGGFNACPSTDVHVAVVQRWEEAFGAALALVTPDQLVLRIVHPPALPRALHVARLEQLWLRGSRRPTVGETKGRLWEWWWD